MNLAGIDTTIFKSHSMRGAVATEVASQGFSTPEILQFADWPQESTFTKVYDRPQYTLLQGERFYRVPPSFNRSTALIMHCSIEASISKYYRASCKGVYSRSII